MKLKEKEIRDLEIKSYCIVRGGAWNDDNAVNEQRVAYRYYYSPPYQDDYIGARLMKRLGKLK